MDLTSQTGLVVLVGAGAGSASLISSEGIKWISRADAVVYDRLIDPSLLRLARAGAELIYVGKAPGGHSMTQQQINDLMVAKARQHSLVVRLKGGDALVFGRGSEEAQALSEAGITFRIVPGITAALTAAAYAGIPLTDRRTASTVALVTGHEDLSGTDKTESAIDWAALAKIDTVVFYMGVENLTDIARNLQQAGRGGLTPAAVVQNAGTPRQKTIATTLDKLAGMANTEKAEKVTPPALIIVGDVVSFHDRFGWYEKLPLFGKTVLATRPVEQSQELCERLAELGAEVIEAPAIAIAPPEDWGEVDSALTRIGEFKWLILTSPNGVSSLFGRMHQLGMDARALGGVKVAAVGPGTASRLAQMGINADLVPPAFTTASLVDAMVKNGQIRGQKILMARADIAPPEAFDVLRANGADVEQITLYRTLRPKGLPEKATEALRGGKVDWITFTSSSTVNNFLELVKAVGVGITGLRLAVIGPVTEATLLSHSLSASVVARPHTIGAMVDGIVAYERGQTK